MLQCFETCNCSLPHFAAKHSAADTHGSQEQLNCSHSSFNIYNDFPLGSVGLENKEIFSGKIQYFAQMINFNIVHKSHGR